MISIRKNSPSGQVTHHLYLTQISRKVARVLLEASEKVNGGNHFSSLMEIASSLNASPEIVNKSLVSLQEKGAVRLEHGRITINRDSLGRIAAG